MRSPDTNPDATSLALQALAWTLADEDRAQRLIDTTGLFPDDLRARIDEPAVLGAALGFLENHEPDLVACAEDLGVKPETLVAARRALAGDEW
jgi:hypothetical protein